MMQPMDGITSQLAMCCGLGRRRDARFMGRMGGPGLAPPMAGYYYSPSMVHMNTGNTWPLSAGYQQHPMPMAGPAGPAGQPYILLTQPVIIASNPTTQATATPNTMTLIHQHQPAGAILAAGHSPTLAISASQHHANGSIMSSQYAIYNPTNAALNVQPTHHQANSIYSTQDARPLQNRLILGPSQQQQLQQQQQQQQRNNLMYQQHKQQQHHHQPTAPLTAEIFKRLELIEKQVDLSKDMDLIERHEIVITRAIDPNSLRPHLTDATLRKYHSYFLFNDDYVVRFIEIIKRPGQTLGLYIRTVQFENIQLRSTREGLVITRIESDSPIYDSQVLHVGDEILSINLVEVQGMSLDDVVIIMSIPKRLVLALRIPRERDQLLKSNLIQQQQMAMRYSRPATTAKRQFAPATNNQIHQSPSHRLMLDRDDIQRDSYQQPSITENTGATYQTSVPRASAEADHSSGLYHARPVRVQSVLQIEEVLNGGGLDGDEADQREEEEQQQQQQQHQMNDLHRNHQQLGGDYNFPSRFTGVSTSYEAQQQANLDGQNGKPGSYVSSNTLSGGGRLGYIDRQMAISGSIDESRLNGGPPADASTAATCRYQTNFAIDQELATLEREAMNKDRHLTSRHQLFASEQPLGSSLAIDIDDINNNNNNNQSNNNNSAPLSSSTEAATNQHDQTTTITSSTLPRRTLPTRPDMISSTAAMNLGSPIKQSNVISTIRLGQTPEQSSYFSSSIDAINRELKELRRQRMALSNNEPTNGTQIA